MTCLRASRRNLTLALFVASVEFAVTGQARAQGVELTNFNISASGTRTVQLSTDVSAYYVLYSGTGLTNLNQPVAMALGTGSLLLFQDSSPQLAAQFYRVLSVPLTQPLDTDGDGMDDVFELNHPGCLNPLDGTDATVDCDGDGRSNLQEYYDGTDPTVADAPARLVINEIDYDQVGTDTKEFVEVLNLGTNTLDLAHYSLAFINGANNLEYLRFELSGTLAGGQYLVAASTNLTAIAAGARVLRFVLGENVIQNGAPDGIALINVGDLTVRDAFSYEGAMTNAVINGFTGTRSLVEGTALSAAIADSNTIEGSLARLPNGTDHNDASTDWNFTATPTPGGPNVP